MLKIKDMKLDTEEFQLDEAIKLILGTVNKHIDRKNELDETNLKGIKTLEQLVSDGEASYNADEEDVGPDCSIINFVQVVYEEVSSQVLIHWFEEECSLGMDQYVRSRCFNLRVTVEVSKAEKSEKEVTKMENKLTAFAEAYDDALIKKAAKLAKEIAAKKAEADRVINRNVAGMKAIINERNIATHIMQVLKKKETGKAWRTSLITIDGNGVADIVPHMVQYTYITPYLEHFKALRTKNAVVAKDGLTHPEKRYCDAMLHVRIDPEALGLVFDGETMRPKNIYRVLGPVDSFWVKISDKEVGNLFTCEKLGKEKFQAWCKQVGCYVYTVAWTASSPGETKQYVEPLYGDYYGPDKSRKLETELIVACKTGGMSVLLNALKACGAILNSNDEKKLFKEAAQLATRLAQGGSCWAMDSTPIRSLLQLPGTFRDENIVDQNGEEFDFADGVDVLRANYLAYALSNAPSSNYEVTEDACEGQLVQARPTSAFKGTFLAVKDEKMEYLVKRYTQERGIEIETILVYKGMSKEQLFNWCLHVVSKGEKGAYAGKAVFLVFVEGAENELPDILGEYCGLKTVFHPELMLGLRILSVAHLDSVKGHMSTQMLQSFLEHDWEYGEALALKYALQDCLKAWRKLDPERTEGHALSWSDFQGKSELVLNAETGEIDSEEKDVNFTDLTNKVAPGFAKKYWAPAYGSMVKRTFTGLSTMFGKCNYEVSEVYHLTMLNDLGATFLGKNVLVHDTETQVTQLFANNKGSNVSVKEYKDAVKALRGVPFVGKKIVNDLIGKLNRGIIVTPASNNFCKLAEGSDYDGDHMFVFKIVGPNGEIIWIALRYPKTHALGYVRLSKDCPLPVPLCVDKD